MTAPQAVVVSIGEEVLRGEATNTNAAFLGRRLSDLGFRVAAGLVVADRPDDIVAALGAALERARLVVVTGGLGPTGDDLTVPAVANFLGVRAIESAEALEGIARRIKCRPEEVAGPRRRMALVPEGARALPNPLGAAPGVHAEKDGGHLFLLPGVPGEMRAIFDESVAPLLEKLFPERARRQAQSWHISGWPESKADATAREKLKDLLGLGCLELGTRLGRGWVTLRMAGEGPDAEEKLAEADRRLAALFGDALWGRGEARQEEAVAGELISRGLKLALAESCTGGLVAARLVSVPGVSACLTEALVTYSDESKTRLLGVPAGLIREHGAVSEECARAMATGLRERSGADITVSLTGIAGPGGSRPGKPAGTVHFAVATADGTESDVRRIGGGRDWVRELAASHALWLIWQAARKCSTA